MFTKQLPGGGTSLSARGSLLGAVFVLFLLPGCETMSALGGTLNGRDAPQINGGAIDVRYWDPHKQAFTTTFFDPSDCNIPSGSPNECVLAPKSILARGDSVSLRVLRAYICNLPEAAGSFSEFEEYSREFETKTLKCISGRNIHFSTRGEVAVLAKVAERKTGAGAVFKQGEIAPSDARLIYYSEDMRETGQPPNFANVPLYGPVTYEGSPILVQLHVVELDDAESEAQRSLLTSLAKLGSAAYPPASSALAVLDKVGTAFLSGQQDDLMFDFLVEFDAGESKGGRSTADLSLPLAQGIYAFVRMGNRNESALWSELVLDHRSGLLHCRDGSETCPRMHDVTKIDANGDFEKSVEARAALTYFVIEVRRNELEGSNLGFQRFDQLVTPRSHLTTGTLLAAEIDSATDEFVTGTLFDQARAEAKNLYSDSITARTRARRAYAAAICAGENQVNGTAVTHPGRALSANELFYLMSLTEEHFFEGKNGTRLQGTPSQLTQKCATSLDATAAALFAETPVP
jgi:hypothetical protein